MPYKDLVKRKEAQRKSFLKHEYGISVEAYQALCDVQNHVCAACGNPPPVYKRGARLYVDHDHSTGRIRGLLCQPCNLAVGWVEGPNAHRIPLAKKYLENCPPRKDIGHAVS